MKFHVSLYEKKSLKKDWNIKNRKTIKFLFGSRWATVDGILKLAQFELKYRII